MSVSLPAFTEYLDRYLNVSEIPDYPNALNGLQVEGAADVMHLAAAVDACQATIDAAVQRGAQLLLVHHGLFWAGLEPVVGRHARRLRTLLESGTALYAAHLPLDLHAEVGNNAVLARRLHLMDLETFGEYQGTAVGLVGSLEMDRQTLVTRLNDELGTTAHLIASGPERTQRVAIISGGAGSMISDARGVGADTFITGEGSHHTHFDAEEWGMNVIYAGHYATETVGVKALAEHAASQFSLSWEFIDHPTGL